MEYQATAKYVRTAPRKLRLVADAIRKMSPQKAVAYLEQVPKLAARPLLTTLQSALANAKQKNVDFGSLNFKTIEVMGGPVLKRWHAVSKGSAHAFKKRMTHVRIVLTEGEKNGTKS